MSEGMHEQRAAHCLTHVALAGDSVFDNGAYVPGSPDVVRQLRAILPPDGQASLLAVDGAVARDVPGQLASLPADATHIVVSAGGNDALSQEWVLGDGVRSVAEAFDRLARVRSRFHEIYAEMLDAALGYGLPVAVCTIYDPRFPEPDRQRVAVAALALFNDVITREAFARNLPLLNLRLICNKDQDFANPIEPSALGGTKIATAIAGQFTGTPATHHGSIVIGTGKSR